MQEKKAACRTAFGASIGRDKFNEGKRISKNVPPPSSPHYDIGILIIKKPLKPGGGGGGVPPIFTYTRRLHLKGVPFSGLKYMEPRFSKPPMKS